MSRTKENVGAHSVGGASEDRPKRKLGWLWWLLLLAGLAALAIFLILRNAGDDGDDAGVDVSDEQSGGANEDADTGEGLGDTADEATDGGDGTAGDETASNGATTGTAVGGADCPSDAGSGTGDETANVGSEPELYDGCQVAVAGSILEAPGEGVLLIQGAGGGEPLVIVLTPEAENPGSDANGEDVEVEGTARTELDANAVATDLEVDEEDLGAYDGQPYVEASSVQISG